MFVFTVYAPTVGSVLAYDGDDFNPGGDFMTSTARKSGHRKPELGKYLLYLHFSKDSVIRKYLPPTSRYSAKALETYLGRYGTVYVKPSGGSRGHGILKVWRRDGDIWVQHTTRLARRFSSIQAATLHIDSMRGGKAYIVQKGITLARVNGRPFDIRVMMQKDVPGGIWQYSGMVAKVAGQGSVVTNVALSHGRVMEVEEALRRALGFTAARARQCMADMVALSHRAAKHFDRYQPYREIGFDVAVDTRGRIWLIEQNTAPSHPLFAKLKSNLALHRRIQFRWGRYQRALHSRGAQSPLRSESR